MHDEFIEPSKSHADIIIPNMKPNTVAIDFLSTVVRNSLKTPNNESN
jgi:uridine kinase